MLILKHTESPKQKFKLYFYIINISRHIACLSLAGLRLEELPQPAKLGILALR
jgi:hypothetical protein